MWFVLLQVLHYLVCLFLIVVVLLQSGKAADLAGAFGGMGSQTAFGPRGSATLLSKATTMSAVLFMLTSLSLSIMETRHSGGARTVFDSKRAAPATTTKGATPATPAAPAAPGAIPPGGQPSVTLSDEVTGAKKTIPLNIPPNPNTQKGQPAPGQQAPAKK